jgi:hypothetical protein
MSKLKLYNYAYVVRRVHALCILTSRSRSMLLIIICMHLSDIC